MHRIQSLLESPADLERNARQFVELTALALQANVLMTGGPSQVTEAFLDSRLQPDRFGCFGTLPQTADIKMLVERAAPVLRSA